MDFKKKLQLNGRHIFPPMGTLSTGIDFICLFDLPIELEIFVSTKENFRVLKKTRASQLSLCNHKVIVSSFLKFSELTIESQFMTPLTHPAMSKSLVPDGEYKNTIFVLFFSAWLGRPSLRVKTDRDQVVKGAKSYYAYHPVINFKCKKVGPLRREVTHS